jgi:hypothetical protein
MIPSPIKVLVIKDCDNEIRVITRGTLYNTLGDFIADIAKSHSMDYKIKTVDFNGLTPDLKSNIMFNYKLDLLVKTNPLTLAQNEFDKFLERESAFDDMWEVAEDGYFI